MQCIQKKKKVVYMKDMTPKQYFQLEVEPKMMETFEAIALNQKKKKQGYKFFKYFVMVDDDGSGEVELDEFYGYYNVQRTKFIDRVFTYFDLDQSNELNFQEYVIGLWNFCTFNQRRMLKFGMDIFDVDDVKKIDKYQCDALVRMIHGVDETPNELVPLIQSMTEDAGNPTGSMDLDAFCVFAENNPSLFQPIFDFQRTLRNSIFGEPFWEEQTQRRTEIFGELATAEDILLRKRKEKIEKQRLLKERSGKSSKVLPKVTEKPSSSILSDDEEVRQGGNDNDEDQNHEHATEEEDEDEEEDRYNALYVVEDAVDVVVKQEEAVKAYHSVKSIRKRYRKIIKEYRELNLTTASNNKNEIDQAKEEELVKQAAHIKQKLQDAVSRLEVGGFEGFEEGEHQAYVRCLRIAERNAEEFFAQREGKEFLKVVGREHATRDGKGEGIMGTMTKKQLGLGEKKARNEYIAKKAREQSAVVKIMYREKREAHQKFIAEIQEENDVYPVDGEDAIRLWQWQKIRDPNSKQFFFYCPIMEASLWVEPLLLNCLGRCEEPSCKLAAVLRCIECNHEYCKDCDMITHAYGPKQKHVQKTMIPQEEIDWRKRIQDIPKVARKELTTKICADPIEIARRHKIEVTNREKALFDES